MNPVGYFGAPAIIFPRKRMKPYLFKDAPEGRFPISDSGLINSELFVGWLKHFKYYVKLTEDDSDLLVLDNHMHCSLEAVTFCREHYITLLSLPPHSSLNYSR
jgi:hypothetical protein